MQHTESSKHEAGFELRFASLSMNAHGYAFPCDCQGRVDLDALSDRARECYLFARASVGFDLYCPVVESAPHHGCRCVHR